MGGGMMGGGMLAMMGGQLPGAGAGSQYQETMDIPKNLVGRCIGKAGAKIKELMADSGTNLSIDQNVPDGMPSKMIIIGTPEQVAKAKELVRAVLDRDNATGFGSLPSIGAPMGGGPSVEVAVPLGNTLLGKIIGKGGETIRNLKAQSGVDRIQLDKDNPGPEGPICRIYGSQEACNICAGMVQAIVNDSPEAAQVYGANSAPTARGGGKGGGQPMGAPQGMQFAPPQQMYGNQPPQMSALPSYMMQQPQMQDPMQQPGMQQQQPGMPMMMQQQPQLQMPGMPQMQGQQGAPQMQGMPQLQMPQMQGLPQMQMPMATPMSQPMSQLPPPGGPPAGGSPWQVINDPNTGRNYYWNTVTHESSWETPPGM